MAHYQGREIHSEVQTEQKYDVKMAKNNMKFW